MDLFKKASLPSIEDYAQQVIIRKKLTGELGRSIRSLQEENLEKKVITDTDECANSLCSIIEAIFIHGLKDKLTAKMTSVFNSSNVKLPEPEFWTFVSRYCHKNVISEIQNLSLISTDIGRGRAWLRIALNDGLIISYLGTILSDKSSLQKFYYTTAYLRDEEQLDIMKQLLEGTGVLHFELSSNDTILNSWNCLPLTLANIWVPPATPQPVMPAVDVIDFFTDQKHQGKSSSKVDSPSIKSKTSVETKVENEASNLSVEGIALGSEPVMTADKETISKSDTSADHSDKNKQEGEKASEQNNGASDDVKQNKVHVDALNKIPECHDNDDASSKISSSDSVPDFGTDAVGDSNEMPYGSFGNKLNEKCGWSSVFDDEREQRDNEASQSYDSLLQSYNKNLSKVVIGTPELADTFSSVMGKTDEYIVIDYFALLSFVCLFSNHIILFNI